jgi:hypothetical protein
MTDLVLLAADKNIESGVISLLRRPEAFGCRRFDFRSFVHPHHDPGCYSRSPAFLSPLSLDYRRALVVFDREGCGSRKNRVDIESEVEARLSSQWGDRAKCVVVDPEIENWVWTDSPHLTAVLGWQRTATLRQWLEAANYWPSNEVKPPRPKEALERVLREIHRPRSSAIYAELGKRASVARCSDIAFLKMREVLTAWFPAALS